MRCKKIRDLLETDYLDRRLGELREKSIKKHLAKCSACRSLEVKLSSARADFKKIERQRVPERIWQNIEHNIIAEQLEHGTNPAYGLLERLKVFLLPSRAVLALASTAAAAVVILFLAGTFIQGNFMVKKNQRPELAEYALNTESDDWVNGLGTDIEEYFL